MQPAVQASDIAAPPQQHRWTAAKLLKRAVFGLVLMFAIIGGSAWMLHTGISSDGARNILAIAKTTIRLTDSVDTMKVRSGSGETLILSQAATSQALNVLRGTRAETALAETASSRAGKTFATLDLSNYVAAVSGQDVSRHAVAGLMIDTGTLLSSGFDGVVLNITRASQGAATSVGDSIVHLARHIRHQRPDAIVLLQGHEQVVARRDVMQAIDGVLNVGLARAAAVSRETLFRNAASVATQHYLDRVARAGKLALVATDETALETIPQGIHNTARSRSYTLVLGDAPLSQSAQKPHTRESVSLSSSTVEPPFATE